MNTLNGQMKDLRQQRKDLEEAYATLGSAGPHWGRVLEALIAASPPGFTIERITAQPNGDVQVAATAIGLETISEFEEALLSSDDILKLVDVQLTGNATTTDVTVFLEAAKAD